MGFDGVKKVEMDEDEGVPYSWEEDDRSAGVHERAQDGFSLTGEVLLAEEAQGQVEQEGTA